MAQKYDYFFFDCDGVLWHGERKMEGQAFRNIEWLESIGKKVFFVTNHGGLSRQSMMAKMQTDVFQYKNTKIDHLYPAATLSAQYVK